jgi:glycosyltransferase involved in cell wall biosynthesis
MEAIKRLPFAEGEPVWTYLRWNSYLSTQRKLLYIATPKVACTTLKWWFASLEGYSKILRGANGSLETDPDLVIHDTFHKVAPAVTGLLPEALAEALMSDEFFRFAVVRNPYKRIFSAWQSKILLREPLQVGDYLQQDFLHHPIMDVADISIAFERFLEHLGTTEAPSFWDSHWNPQVELLRPDLVHYSMLANVEDTAALSRELLARLGPGVQDPFAIKRSNESLIPYSPDLISARSGELIRSMYAQDFNAFGFELAAPEGRARLTNGEFNLARHSIGMLRGKNHRFSEIRDHNRNSVSSLERTIAEHVRQISSLRQGVAERDAIITSLGEEARNRDDELRHSNVLLAEREHVVVELMEAAKVQNDAFAMKDGQLKELQAARDRQLVAFEAGLLQRDVLVTELREAIEKRTEEVVELGQALRESRERLNQCKVDHDGQIRKLESHLREGNARIATLEHELFEGNASVKDLEKGWSKQNVQIDELSRALQARSVELVERDQEHAIECRKLERAVEECLGKLYTLSLVRDELRNVNEQIQRTLFWRVGRKLRLVRLPSSRLPEGEQTNNTIPEEFDGAWYLAQYPDVAAAGMDPFDHYQLAGKSEGRLPKPPKPPKPATSRQPRLKKMRVLRTGMLAGVRRAGGFRKAVEKIVTVAKRDGWFEPDFDAEFYLQMYPDIREAGVGPYEHFVRDGRAEGRVGSCPKLVLQEGAIRPDASKKTVLVVAHEASRTGAPILSLNIARELQRHFNVVVLLLGDGPLVAAFCEVTCVVVGPMLIRGNISLASAVMRQLSKTYEFEFAIVNSIESRYVLMGLVELSIPAITLIHEFAAYTRPKDAFGFAIKLSSETVFSARITYENAIFEYPEIAEQKFHIIPQGRCTMLAGDIDPEEQLSENRRVMRCLRPAGLTDQSTVVIIGAGYVQYRKGVDLFLECAARVIKAPGGEKCRFVWIGNGYDPIHDMGYSVYLSEQIQRAGLSQQFVFMDGTTSIDQAYMTADMLMMSSRLDPLPNVAIDAMAHGLPVVCFDRTTGVVDALTDCGLATLCVAPYLDTAAMADLVSNFARSKSLRDEVGVQLQRAVRENFDMTRYVARLEELAESSIKRQANEVDSAKCILGSGMLRPDFCFSAGYRRWSSEDLIRYEYVRSWAAGISKRKPFPGFHPGIYMELKGLEAPGIDPLASYLRAGQPEGPWRSEVISSEDPITSTPDGLRVALHLHVYYPELLGDMLRRLSANFVRPDLFVSVPNERIADEVRRELTKYSGRAVDVQVVPNVGRDLGPLFTAFGRTFVDQYDIVGHVHTKKSADIAEELTGKVWREFLMENLLGGKAHMADLILGRMAADEEIGVVFPDDPNIVGWGANRPYAEKLRERLGLHEFPENMVFPVGSMFWARSNAIRPLFDLGLSWQDYPSEPLPYDGSMLHALERILPFVARGQSSRIVLTNVVGTTR